LKSVCTIFQEKNYDESVLICANNGMKIFNANDTVVDNALTSFSNLQWPYGTFWIEGKYGSVCAASSDTGRITFERTNLTCSNGNYFHCEFTGEFLCNEVVG
jgi:hypothetical protein